MPSSNETNTAPPAGLVLSRDEVFSAQVRAGLATGGSDAVLHRVESVSDAVRDMALHAYVFALLDARHSPLHVADTVLTLMSDHPRLPVIVCLAPGEVQPPVRQLRGLGAFEVVNSNVWPCEHLLAAINHAVWFADAANDVAPTQALGVAEPDRPLLAEVSHEMRSPLNSIIGFAESIEQQALGPWPAQSERYRDYARLIRNSGEHLLELFNDLLQIGDTGFFDLEIADSVSPNELAENIVAMMQPAAKQKDLTLSCDLPGTANPLHCNARLVSQALLNLLQNSIKFTDAGGTVLLGVSQDRETRFTVTDTGIGFAANRLTQPRNATAGRTPGSGHGLGLRFVERVTAAHRGRLQIESTPGLGSQITVALPTQGAVKQCRNA